jgi:hypothetical protein
VLVDALGDVEVGVGIPAQDLLRRAHLVLAERGAVRLRRVLRVRGRVGDVAADDDERRPFRLVPRRREGSADRVEIVHVRDSLDVPAVRLEALALVLRPEREGGRAVDRYPVVVIDDYELAQPEGAGEGGRLRAHALHEVPVRRDDVHLVVDDLVSDPVVALPEKALCHRHPDGVRDSLAERPGGGLDAGRQEVLGMPRRERFPLAKPLQLLERQVVAGEVQRRVLEDAGMPCREDEAVAVFPVGVRGIRPQELPVDDVGDRRERHRRPRMTRTRLLHRVHGERANRVDRQLLEIGLHGTP